MTYADVLTDFIGGVVPKLYTRNRRRTKAIPVRIFKNGNYVGEYASIAEASRQTSINPTTLQLNLNLPGWTDCRGINWRIEKNV